MTTDQPSLSPCRRNDQHDPHVYEVHCRPFQCPGRDKPRTDAEKLAELRPLAKVIAEKLRTVPVRLIGPGGADDLVAELTLAVALYCATHVLPGGPPVDRKTVLREAATRAWEHGRNLSSTDDELGIAGEIQAELLRMADKEQRP